MPWLILSEVSLFHIDHRAPHQRLYHSSCWLHPDCAQAAQPSPLSCFLSLGLTDYTLCPLSPSTAPAAEASIDGTVFWMQSMQLSTSIRTSWFPPPGNLGYSGNLPFLGFFAWLCVKKKLQQMIMIHLYIYSISIKH